MRKDSSALLSIVFGLIIGVLAGLLAVLLLSPKSRPENGRKMAGAASASSGSAGSSDAPGQQPEPVGGKAGESPSI